jgi:hypothetical protein
LLLSVLVHRSENVNWCFHLPTITFILFASPASVCPEQFFPRCHHWSLRALGLNLSEPCVRISLCFQRFLLMTAPSRACALIGYDYEWE